jgi:DNA invertase Pin-like site-specific DNA recombinase
MPKLAAGYIRLSRWKGDADPSTSPDRQRELIKNYCQSQGYELVEIFEDLDVSGSVRGRRLERPALRRLRSRWAEFDAVVFSKIDRLSRSVIDFNQLVIESREHEAALVSVEEGFDLGSPMGKMQADLLSIFAEFEAATIRERTLAGKAKSRELGRWQGGNVPAAHMVNEVGTLELVEEEADILRAAADALLSGASVQSMVRQLNESQLRPRKKKTESGLLAEGNNRPAGERWSPRTAKRVLTGPFAPAILGVERSELVRERLAENGSGVPRNPVRLLSSVARCAACGGPMYTGKSNNGKATYRCVARSHGEECGKPQVIAANPFDEYMTNWWLDRKGDEEQWIRVRVSDERTQRVAELTLEYRQRKAALATLDLDKIAGEAAELQQIADTIEELRSRRGALTAKVVKTGRLWREVWEVVSIAERRDLIRRALPGGFLTIGPGKAGIKGFQVERVLDREKLIETPPDFEDEPDFDEDLAAELWTFEEG